MDWPFWVYNPGAGYIVPWGADHPELFRSFGGRFLVYVAG